jgi:hypothetical protein
MFRGRFPQPNGEQEHNKMSSDPELAQILTGLQNLRAGVAQAVASGRKSKDLPALFGRELSNIINLDTQRSSRNTAGLSLGSALADADLGLALGRIAHDYSLATIDAAIRTAASLMG